METAEKTRITVEATVNAPVEKVWKLWTGPQYIVRWNYASDDWHTTWAENDLRKGGKFASRMEAKDGSAGFDFEGIYDEVIPDKRLSYAMSDGRKVQVEFRAMDGKTVVTETFDPETVNPIDMQRSGWQAILDNFKKYVESTGEEATLNFEILINAPAKKVYKTMIDEKTYKEWTYIFNPTSSFRGSWDKGSKILFVGSDENGKEGGMVTIIKENIPNRYVSLQHIGIYEDGKEVTSGSKVEKWSGALENYTFTERDGNTLVSVDMDSNEEFDAYFKDTWPKALQKLKEICER